tara:strand:+ start:5291 stop:5527 length:237 start_codon:yes stop_codon:yes gene_type:complete
LSTGKIMYTIEHEKDYSSIHVLDTNGEADDVELIFDENNVYIRQYDEDDHFNIVLITPQMFEEIIAAYNSPEGAYITK